MRFSLAVIIAFAAVLTNAAPLSKRQGAGVGAACNSIFTDADTMLGNEATKSIGEGLAGDLKGTGDGLLRRQGAGVGAGCDSILTDADTMLGNEATKGIGETIAGDLKGTGNTRRQLNGIADGLTAVTGDVPALEAESDQLDSQLNTIDGEGTDGSAQLGETIGDTELQVGNILGGGKGTSGGSGAAPAGPGPKRQLNGIADGLTAPLENYGATQELGSNLDSYLNTIDGQGTDDAAELGQIVGDEELQLGKTIGGSNAGGAGTGAAKGGPKRK